MPYKPKNYSKFYFYVDSQAAWECLENGKDITTIYPDYFKEEITDTKYHNHMKSVVTPDEKYVLLEDKMYDYALTSLGRVINCIHGTQCFVYFKKNNIVLNMRNSKLNLRQIFEEQGWEFNLQELLDNYKKYEWKHK
jgi:hypothetical protein